MNAYGMASVLMGICLWVNSLPAAETTQAWEEGVDSAMERFLDESVWTRRQFESRDAFFRKLYVKLYSDPDVRREIKSLAIQDGASLNFDAEEAVLEAFAEFMCRNLREGCALKNRLAELEQQQKGRERLGSPEPTPADAMPPQKLPAANVWPTPVEPRPVWTRVPRWHGQLGGIKDDSRKLSPNAALVARCVDMAFPDYSVYHGDVYYENGTFVLLRHHKTIAKQAGVVAAVYDSGGDFARR